MTSATFDPTPAAPTWLDLAAQLQLERDLANLPDLADLLDRNYFHLLARGDRDPRDSAVRYVTRFDVLDLADTRTKDGLLDTDAPGLADLNRRADARRLGILPNLELWIRMAEADMLDEGVEHTDPVIEGSSVTTAAGWLRRHLDWILGQQWVIELADEVRRIVLDLDALGVGFAAIDRSAIGTVNELAQSTGVPAATIYRWAANGYLQPVNDTRPKHYFRTEVLALRKTTN